MLSKKLPPSSDEALIRLGQTPSPISKSEWTLPADNVRVDIRPGARLVVANGFSISTSSYVDTSTESFENRLPHTFVTNRRTRKSMKRSERHSGRDIALKIEHDGVTVEIPLTGLTPLELESTRDALITAFETARLEAVHRENLIKEVVEDGYVSNGLVPRLYRKVPVLHGTARAQREYSEGLRSGLKRIAQVVTGGSDLLGHTRGAVRSMANGGPRDILAAHDKAASEFSAALRGPRRTAEALEGLQDTDPRKGHPTPPA